ncbi:MAG: hypothetical protein P1P80_07985 [ANME-2 cluster archaeon]|nr:hypothetical protein [ANME-2 cluster archaeon]
MVEKLDYGKIGEIAIYKLYPFVGTKKLLLIRPKKPNDPYTELGSYIWAGNVKQRALDLGWQVTDLAINNATRENVESKMNEIKPNLVIHYDHGSSFTLWGQEADSLEPAIDSANVGILSNRIASTVSCQSASGLGPLAITNGATSYMGYDENHVFVVGHQDEFGEASNAANYALLECKSVQEAYNAGIAAYTNLYNDLIASGDVFAANWALHDRDCFVMLGSGDAIACPTVLHCRIGLPDRTLHCVTGLPDSIIFQCRIGLPDSINVCRTGSPMMTCAAGPNMLDKCAAGPIMDNEWEWQDQPFKKPLTQLERKIQLEK